MPEGPEVRISADQIERAVAGKVLKCSFVYSSLLGFEHSFQDVTLNSIDTYGKAFVLNFSNQLCIYVHLQLYGRWKTGKLTGNRTSRRTVRLILETNTHHATLYSATDVEVLSQTEVKHHKFIRKLGPDLLNSGYKSSHISRRLAKPKYSRRGLGGLLLDQSVFAGLGNYLRSEILFRSQLHPNRTLGSLSQKERTLLARMIHETTLRSYKTKGITLDQTYVEHAKNMGWKRSAYRHFTFGRENKNCWICQTAIEKCQISGRRLYLCSNCQQ